MKKGLLSSMYYICRDATTVRQIMVLAGQESSKRRSSGEFWLFLWRLRNLCCLLMFEYMWCLLMPEITAMLHCQPRLCILPGRKSGCTCHHREVTREVKHKPESQHFSSLMESHHSSWGTGSTLCSLLGREIQNDPAAFQGCEVHQGRSLNLDVRRL